jgi:glucose-6-phosphate 1-dehydrogenase
MKTIFVLFWSTWDLAKRKIFPALYNIYKNQGKEVDVIWVWRRDFDDEQFRKFLDENLKTFVDRWSNFKDFLGTISYSKVNLDEGEDYKALQSHIESIDTDKNAQIIFYLSISPEYFGDFISHYTHIENTNARVIFEKPFWVDLGSARELNAKIKQAFREEQIYRIDHYLWKEAIQNILAFRFSNLIFQSTWNNKYIDNIQITASESLWIEKRWWYYDASWALRDMVQNHLFQALSLVAMDTPESISADAIRQEKLKVFQNIHLWKDFGQNIVFGQYDWYKEAEWVQEGSKTETFVAMKIDVDTPSFSSIPIYLRTWKLMNKKSTKIVVEFKDMPDNLYKKFGNVGKNRIILDIQPQEWIDIQFNIKENGDSPSLQEIHSSFSNGKESKEAYQKLIEDMIDWDKTLFISWDVLEESWRIVEDLVNCHDNCPIVFPYKWWENGPKESYDLLERDGKKWHE